MTKTELQSSLAEATQTDKKTAGVFLDTLSDIAYKEINYFFTPKTPSFSDLATRNLTTVLAGILIFCCVFGLKPVRAFLFCFTSLPKTGQDKFAVLLNLFVGDVAECIEKYSSGSFVGLSGFGKCALQVWLWAGNKWVYYRKE